ncbi:MAG: carboxypeptidase-like regulatory domain-containing protein, partial [Saprospiraceae bacterium]
MPRSFLLFFSYILATAFVRGQEISGYVRDSLGEAVPFASVVATGCQNEQVLAFTTTDHLGQYQIRLQTDCDSIGLTARGLGYQPMVHRWNRGSIPLQQDFVLFSTGLAIREIVIRDKPLPVVARRDTTDYDAAAFSDSTEFSVEDLLKKIPGIRVGENGSLTYNGKTVERVLLEGDDLFTNNYTLATRNLRANMVAKVQMIDRYQENQLLKGIRESDRLVMNLTIRPDRKRSLSGSATGGLGYGEEWKAKAHTNLFSLSRKDKFYLIANANNMGEDAVSDVQWMSQGNVFDPSRQLLEATPLQPGTLVQLPMLENVGLPTAYTQRNRSGLLYMGEVLPVAPGFKVKISGWAGKENLSQTVVNTTRYLLDSTILEIGETRSTRLQSRISHLQMTPEYFSKNKKHALRGFLTISGKPVDGRLNLVRNPGADTTFQIVQRITEHAAEAFAAVEYTLKSSEACVFQIVSKNAWFRKPSVLSPVYAYYAPFFGLDAGFDQLQQTVEQQQGESLVLLRLLLRSKFMQWQLEAGQDWQWGSLHSDLHLQNKVGEVWRPDTSSFYNQLRLTAPYSFAQGMATGIFGPVLIRAQLQMRHQTIHLNVAKLTKNAPSPWAAEPQFDLRYVLGDRSTFTGFYKFQQALPTLTDLYPAALFTDYQTLERGLPELTRISSHQAGLAYRYNDRLQQFAWNIAGGWRQEDNGFGSQYQINPYLIVREAFRPVKSVSYALNGGGDRYVKEISMRFALGAGFNIRREQGRINGALLRDLQTRSYQLSMSIGTAFDGWVNAILDSRLNNIILRVSPDLRLPTAYWFSTLTILVKPVARL